MSIHVKTAAGLVEIGGSVTKEKVISALGYEPADEKVEKTVENHIKDNNVHITSSERELWTKNVENLDSHKSNTSMHVTSTEKQTWNNKSDFSGAYVDLEGKPNITENDSGNMVIADENGNIIMQVDEGGLATTNVSAKTIQLDGEDLETRLDTLESMSLPNIIDNESDNLVISDESGNVVAKFDANGFETTTVTAKNVVVDGKDVGVKFDEQKESIEEVSENLTSHTSNSNIHVTLDDKTLWNNKSDFSGDYNDLKNAPDIKEDNTGEVVYADESGNVIVKIGENGLETTQVIANDIVANGTNVGTKLNNLDSTLSTHTSDNDIHITDEERAIWNAKSNFSGDYNDLTNKPTDIATTTYVNEQVATLVDSAPETLNTLNELAAALGDDPNFATTVANQIGLKANQTNLDSHVSNTTLHITNEERVKWNNKSEFSGDYNDLENAPNIYEDDSDNLVIADQNGNIIFRSDVNGFETTTLTAKNVVVNGTDVEVRLNEHSNTLNTYVLNIDYTQLQFDTSEIV